MSTIATEPIGSIPRPLYLLQAMQAFGKGDIQADEMSRFSGLTNLSGDGIVIPFADGHTRQLPKLTSGTLRYQIFPSEYLKTAKKFTQIPVEQAVISASAISFLYPSEGIEGYIPVARLGSTDDCGFSPFADDVSTAREIAFANIKARMDGTRLAQQKI